MVKDLHTSGNTSAIEVYREMRFSQQVIAIEKMELACQGQCLVVIPFVFSATEFMVIGFIRICRKVLAIPDLCNDRSMCSKNLYINRNS